MTILYQWDGEAMVPHKRFAKECDRLFVIGENYPLEVMEGRSWKSHDHYFAVIHKAWLNLPEHAADRFPTPEHLRKYALITACYRDERSIVASSKAEALRIAAFIRPMDEYAVVVVRECLVIVATAKSQSAKAMGGKIFQESKQAVLDVIASIIGVEPDALSAQGRMAA